MVKVLLHLFKRNSIDDRDCKTVSYHHGNRYGKFPNRLVHKISNLPPHVTIRLTLGTVKESPIIYLFSPFMSLFGDFVQEVRRRWIAY